MRTVIETPSYLRNAKAEGMTPMARRDAVRRLANDTLLGDAIVGADGYRKHRLPGGSFMRSGGRTMVTFTLSRRHPIYMLAILPRHATAAFNQREIAALQRAAERMAASAAPRLAV